MSRAASFSKDQIKAEVDKVRDEDLDVLYRVILALAEPMKAPPQPETAGAIGWSQFISEMYGSTSDAPLERWPEGARGIIGCVVPQEVHNGRAFGPSS